ncbi:MAG: hypothetical protein RBU27_13115 [Bacteroidota bacterium]|jgi:hypothetical protein|nr:hypothetical protein [Bacteroidota bacterium]
MFILLVLLILLAAVVVYLFVQHQAFSSMVWREVRALAGERPTALAPVIDRAALPAPMQRYLAWALPAGREPATFARMRHGGTFRRSNEEPWFPIRGEQYYDTAEPAFVWAATMKLNALLWVRGRDKYTGGHGHMLIKPLGVFTAADMAGPEMDQSTLLRYMSEMPWFPSAFLTVPGIEYAAVDDDTVELRMTHGGISVRGRFTFDHEGKILRFDTDDRFREIDGRMLLTPWYGIYEGWGEFDGMRIPLSAAVSWRMSDGPLTYARFVIERMEYDIPHPF